MSEIQFRDFMILYDPPAVYDGANFLRFTDTGQDWYFWHKDFGVKRGRYTERRCGKGASKDDCITKIMGLL